MKKELKITIIDDEQDVRESIAQWLTLSGFQTEEFQSAVHALKVINKNYPGIIISDIKMPDMDGIEFLISKLKNTKNNSDFFDSMNKSAN